MMKIYKEKILGFLLLFISLFTIYMCNLSAHAEVETGLAPGEDPSIYNTSWTKANVNYWVIYERLTLFGGIRTKSYIRITDTNGNFINNVVRLKACYKIDGKNYIASEDISNSGNEDHVFTFGNVFSKTGQFTVCTERDNKYCMSKDFKDFDKAESEYKECNFKWMWNYKVTEIVYLYVWYIDPITGREVAGSFMPEGAHPMYDSNGILQGIYDVDGNLLNDYTMDADGIIEDETGKDLVTPADQFKGQVENTTLFKTASDAINNFLDTILKVFLIILGAVIFLGLIFLITKIINNLRRK